MGNLEAQAGRATERDYDMNAAKWGWSCCCCTIVIAMLAGCGGGARQPSAPATPPAKDFSQPKPPPAVPAAKVEVVNQALREAARNRINDSFATTDDRLRGNAIEAAQDVLGAEAHDMVETALKDKAAFVRFCGVMAAGKLQFYDLHDAILALANDQSPRVRVAVRYALHRIGDARLTHDLEKFARDPEPRVREDTAFVLGQLGEKSAIPKILGYMTNDPDPGVRIQVAESMWRLGDERALEVLVPGTVSRFADDRMFCLMAIVGPKDRRIEQHVRGQLTDEYEEVALVAARALGELGLDDGYGVALKYLNSTAPRQRTLAATALGAIGRIDAQTVLAPLLNDPDLNVRLAAATAILQLKPPRAG